MHEMPVVRSILSIAQKHAREHGATKVSAISLVVGEGTGYVPDSIQLYFDIAAKGTLCEGASIETRLVKPQLQCSACGKRFKRTPFSFDCPDCGSPGSPTEVGREFYIESIEIEIPSDQGEATDEGNDTCERDGGSHG